MHASPCIHPPSQEFTQPQSDRLLPDLPPQEAQVYTLVVDLEGTLVNSQWKVRIRECAYRVRVSFTVRMATSSLFVWRVYTLVVDLEGNAGELAVAGEDKGVCLP